MQNILEYAEYLKYSTAFSKVCLKLSNQSSVCINPSVLLVSLHSPSGFSGILVIQVLNQQTRPRPSYHHHHAGLLVRVSFTKENICQISGNIWHLIARYNKMHIFQKVLLLSMSLRKIFYIKTGLDKCETGFSQSPSGEIFRRTDLN